MLKVRTTFFACIVLVAGCSTGLISPAEVNPNTESEPVLPSQNLLTAARLAGEKCRVMTDPHLPGTCSSQPETLDRAACLAFDDAIQSALTPIIDCRESGHFSEHSEQSTACAAYLDAFFQPCVGGHALQMAYADRDMSKSYRAAIADGMDEHEARTRFLSQVIRYRD